VLGAPQDECVACACAVCVMPAAWMHVSACSWWVFHDSPIAGWGIRTAGRVRLRHAS
jgi:hypothetical protein